MHTSSLPFTAKVQVSVSMEGKKSFLFNELIVVGVYDRLVILCVCVCVHFICKNNKTLLKIVPGVAFIF